MVENKNYFRFNRVEMLSRKKGMTEKSTLQTVFISLIFLCLMASAVLGQTTMFNYQGRLSDSGTLQITYQMEFRLFDSFCG